MADELIIEGLRVSWDSADGAVDEGAQIVVDAIVETDFSVSLQEAPGLSITEVCQQIERLCAGEPLQFLEGAAVNVVDGLMERFQQIDGIELTIRRIEPKMPGLKADSVGVRRRRRRAAPGQRLPRRVIKPLPG